MTTLQKFRSLLEKGRLRPVLLRQRGMPQPGTEIFGDDAFARISMALLEKSPMPVTEIVVRTELPSEEIDRALIEKGDNFGRYIVLITPSGRATHLHKYARTAKRTLQYCEVSVTPQDGVVRLVDYVCDNLLEPIRAQELHPRMP